MANWDEDSGYYCLLIAILCNAHGQLGDILILLKEEDNCSAIEEVAFLKIDGKKCYPGIRYTVKGIENHQEAICA